MKWKFKSDIKTKRNYNKFIDEEGIKQQVDEENQKKYKQLSQYKLRKNSENQINNIYDESNIESSISKLKIDKNEIETIFYNNGDIYIGEMKNGLRIKGLLIHKNFSRY
jgi:hypothetical protein